MNKYYNSFEEIQYDLKRLNLERQIAIEELKLIKSEVNEELKPYNWIPSILGMLKKYGMMYLLKKIIK
ncbi:hypothetical protein [Aquimarina brevivitae]|uniref:Glutaminyl-tRNA synthetase n=1 Tax=Aquimarina brevivitae TaxID=323412 RepID=A0A4Q7PIH6_9FLAO|nr:hypothetical protein [Aquimarina brevivitae]RZT00048.1 hypothetical protein EV197_1278 [Aquimarina brevivitae]